MDVDDDSPVPDRDDLDASAVPSPATSPVSPSPRKRPARDEAAPRISVGGLALTPSPRATKRAANPASKSRPRPRGGAATPGAGEWTRDQVIALQRAQQAVDPGASHFWREVARLVPGKSADECFARTYEGHPTPGDVDDGPGTAPGKGTKIAGARATKGQAGARQRMRERRWEQREEELLTYEDDAFEVFEFDETPQTTPVKATRLAAVVHMAVGSDGGDDAGGLARRVSPRRAGGKSAGGGQLAARLAARRSAQEARDGYIERWLKKRGGRATARAEGDASAEARQQAQAAAAAAARRGVRTEIGELAAAARAPRVKSPGETDDEDVPAEAYFDESDEEA